MPRTKPKEKKCAYSKCQETFIQFKSTDKYHSPICKIEDQKEKLIDLKVEEIKEKLKNHGWWLGAYQAVFNLWVRKRDKGKPCVSCDKKLDTKHDAGHYWSVKPYSGVRFDEDNVHAQCVHCNQHLDGNLGEYTIGLEKRIGKERFEALKERRHKELKISIPEIKERIQYYKQKIKELKHGNTTNNIL